MRQDFLQYNTKPDPCNTETGSDIKTMSPNIVNRDMSLHDKVCKTYRDNFTTHGLSKIFNDIYFNGLYFCLDL